MANRTLKRVEVLVITQTFLELYPLLTKDDTVTIDNGYIHNNSQTISTS